MVVEFSRRGAGTRYPTAGLKTIAVETLAALQQQQTELSVVLVGDKQMRALNARYRKKHKTTDVLSFPADKTPVAAPVLLGDVVISVEQARRQARERKKSLKSEMVILLIHGILHLLGYDHERSHRQAMIMADLEQKLLRDLCEHGLIKV